MTQLEKFIALYKEFGIELKIEKTEEKTEITFECPTGYDFFSIVEFDKDGNFVTQSLLE